MIILLVLPPLHQPGFNLSLELPHAQQLQEGNNHLLSFIGKNTLKGSVTLAGDNKVIPEVGCSQQRQRKITISRYVKLNPLGGLRLASPLAIGNLPQKIGRASCREGV